MSPTFEHNASSWSSKSSLGEHFECIRHAVPKFMDLRIEEQIVDVWRSDLALVYLAFQNAGVVDFGFDCDQCITCLFLEIGRDRKEWTAVIDSNPDIFLQLFWRLVQKISGCPPVFVKCFKQIFQRAFVGGSFPYEKVNIKVKGIAENITEQNRFLPMTMSSWPSAYSVLHPLLVSSRLWGWRR